MQWDDSTEREDGISVMSVGKIGEIKMHTVRMQSDQSRETEEEIFFWTHRQGRISCHCQRLVCWHFVVSAERAAKKGE